MYLPVTLEWPTMLSNKYVIHLSDKDNLERQVIVHNTPLDLLFVLLITAEAIP